MSYKGQFYKSVLKSKPYYHNQQNFLQESYV